jgi:hypothetical protein
MAAQLIALMMALAAAGQARTAEKWTTATPPGAGFTIQAPGTSKPDPNDPMKFSFVTEDSAFIVEVDPLDAAIAKAVAEGNQAFIVGYIAVLRDELAKNLNGKIGSSSAASFDGYPSIYFSASGAAGGMSYDSAIRIVVTDERMYQITAIGTTGKLTKADIDRFQGSFKLAAHAPVSADAFRTISFNQLVCGKIPSSKIRFDVPADFIGRAPTPSIEAGCLWGTQDDLERVTANPNEGDFTSLRRGVFFARVSTNIVNIPATGIFDQMDGSGEAGIRASLNQAGGKVIVWKKETVAGLPALQIVADAMGSRVYMLYLGNVQSSSNAMLLNYYRPKKSGPADDKLWARFIEGIKKAE